MQGITSIKFHHKRRGRGKKEEKEMNVPEKAKGHEAKSSDWGRKKKRQSCGLNRNDSVILSYGCRPGRARAMLNVYR